MTLKVFEIGLKVFFYSFHSFNNFLFGFAKTWAQIEITKEEDLSSIMPFLTDTFNFTKERKKK